MNTIITITLLVWASLATLSAIGWRAKAIAREEQLVILRWNQVRHMWGAK